MSDDDVNTADNPPGRRMARGSTITAALIILAVVSGLWVQSLELSYPSNVFPQLVFAAIFVLAVLVLVTAMLRGSAAFTMQNAVGRLQRLQIAAMVAATAIYVALMTELGFYATTFLFLGVLFTAPALIHRGQTARLAATVGINVLIAAGVTGVVFACFRLMLQVPTPQGVLP